MKLNWIMGLFLLHTNFLFKGREAKCANLLAENDVISPEGVNANLSYTLVTQREPDHQVQGDWSLSNSMNFQFKFN